MKKKEMIGNRLTFGYWNMSVKESIENIFVYSFGTAEKEEECSDRWQREREKKKKREREIYRCVFSSSSLLIRFLFEAAVKETKISDIDPDLSDDNSILFFFVEPYRFNDDYSQYLIYLFSSSNICSYFNMKRSHCSSTIDVFFFHWKTTTLCISQILLRKNLFFFWCFLLSIWILLNSHS